MSYSPQLDLCNPVWSVCWSSVESVGRGIGSAFGPGKQSHLLITFNKMWAFIMGGLSKVVLYILWLIIVNCKGTWDMRVCFALSKWLINLRSCLSYEFVSSYRLGVRLTCVAYLKQLALNSFHTASNSGVHAWMCICIQSPFWHRRQFYKIDRFSWEKTEVGLVKLCGNLQFSLRQPVIPKLTFHLQTFLNRSVRHKISHGRVLMWS